MAYPTLHKLGSVDMLLQPLALDTELIGVYLLEVFCVLADVLGEERRLGQAQVGRHGQETEKARALKCAGIGPAVAVSRSCWWQAAATYIFHAAPASTGRSTSSSTIHRVDQTSIFFVDVDVKVLHFKSCQGKALPFERGIHTQLLRSSVVQ
jgi:hypothetical protein